MKKGSYWIFRDDREMKKVKREGGFENNKHRNY